MEKLHAIDVWRRALHGMHDRRFRDIVTVVYDRHHEAPSTPATMSNEISSFRQSRNN